MKVNYKIITLLSISIGIETLYSMDSLACTKKEISRELIQDTSTFQATYTQDKVTNYFGYETGEIITISTEQQGNEIVTIEERCVPKKSSIFTPMNIGAALTALATAGLLVYMNQDQINAFLADFMANRVFLTDNSLFNWFQQRHILTSSTDDATKIQNGNDLSASSLRTSLNNTTESTINTSDSTTPVPTTSLKTPQPNDIPLTEKIKNNPGSYAIGAATGGIIGAGAGAGTMLQPIAGFAGATTGLVAGATAGGALGAGAGATTGGLIGTLTGSVGGINSASNAASKTAAGVGRGLMGGITGGTIGGVSGAVGGAVGGGALGVKLGGPVGRLAAPVALAALGTAYAGQYISDYVNSSDSQYSNNHPSNN